MRTKVDYDSFIDALYDHGSRVDRRGADQAQAQCPAHDDRNPSLSVSRADNGKPWFYCHAGCSAGDILAALGLDQSAILGDSGETGWTLQMQYPYRDANGSLVMYINKFTNGEKRPQLPDGSAKGAARQDRVLYNLQAVLAEKGLVYFTEGESDAEALIADGYTATTKPFGIKGAMLPQYVEALRHVGQVIVVADNDEAETGLKGARHIANALGGATVLMPPDPYKDVREMYEAGLTVDDLQPAPEITAEWMETTYLSDPYGDEIADIPKLPASLRMYEPGDTGGTINPISEDIYQGYIGEWLETVEPNTEATLEALGASFLTIAGAIIGRNEHHFQSVPNGIRLAVGGTVRHSPNLFTVLVGPSGTGRKGTAMGVAMDFARLIDSNFVKHRVLPGLGSGEAIMARIADYVDRQSKAPYSDDQRLLIKAGEFARILTVGNRAGSALTEIIREAFDDAILGNATVGERLVSSNHCISLLGAITPAELQAKFDTLSTENGFGNRVLWVYTDTDKSLPFGGENVDAALGEIAADIAEQILYRRNADPYDGITTMEMSDAALDMWGDIYHEIRSGEFAPERVRGMVTRAGDHLSRIALIYAVTEGSEYVEPEHLEAGYAWVRYSAETIAATLGGITRPIAGRVLGSVRSHPGIPASRSDLMRSLKLNASEMESALKELEAMDVIYRWKGESNGGRPPEYVIATARKELY